MDEDYDEDHVNDFIRMTISFQATCSVLLSILIIWTISGNTLTIIAYITDKRLHTVYDFFIFNLAVTDLLIGCISMPFYAIYTLKEFIWDFGVEFCKIWNVIDFTLCSESIILILMLSFDRLCLVKYGPFYSSKVTKPRARLVVCTSWIISFMLYGPAIIGWDHWVGYTIVEPRDCDVEFAYNFIFTTTAAVIEFIIPVSGLAILNFLIYKHIQCRVCPNLKRRSCHSSTITKAKSYPIATERITLPAIKNGVGKSSDISSRRVQNEERRPDNIENNLNETLARREYLSEMKSFAKGEGDGTIKVSDFERIGKLSHEKCALELLLLNKNCILEKQSNQVQNIERQDISKPQENGCDYEVNMKGIDRKQGHFIDLNREQNEMRNRIRFAGVPKRVSLCNISTTSTKHTSRKPGNKKDHSRMKRDAKAAKFLAFLVIVFLVCWAPYTVTTIIISICGDSCVNTTAYECMNWLLWSKSAINPLLYALNSSRFRSNFKKYTFCWRNHVHPNDTETSCQTAG